MKTFILKSSALVFVFLLLFVAFSTSSCKKDKTCHGTVKVIDSTGKVISNAAVKLAAPSVNGQVTYSGTTGGTGTATFEVKLPAIFDVTATQSLYPGKIATGLLRLDEPGKTNDLTVTLK